MASTQVTYGSPKCAPPRYLGVRGVHHQDARTRATHKIPRCLRADVDPGLVVDERHYDVLNQARAHRSVHVATVGRERFGEKCCKAQKHHRQGSTCRRAETVDERGGVKIYSIKLLHCLMDLKG